MGSSLPFLGSSWSHLLRFNKNVEKYETDNNY